MFLEKRSSGKQSQITLGGRTALRVIPEDGNIRGTLLAVHGMTAKGNTDPRIHVLASAFAANGYEVILPHYPE
ncbi:MAG: alpha/beta hydrolase, partial [Leptospiraceae bacterium]|nr:alpha/beta hydrolase [Leptospiraceae bacterium]